jgi:hypothetical protein
MIKIEARPLNLIFNPLAKVMTLSPNNIKLDDCFSLSSFPLELHALEFEPRGFPIIHHPSLDGPFKLSTGLDRMVENNIIFGNPSRTSRSSENSRFPYVFHQVVFHMFSTS